MKTYYNDNCPFSVAWLRELMKDGLISEVVIDGRDIRELRADELVGYGRQHFFAGVAGWDFALRLAGWPADREVWSGSCPCTPFSNAGKRKGEEDERHLWPTWMALIRECRPDCILGEQVGNRDGYRWVDGVRTDLEQENYAFGVADLPAACVGSPHIRQRLFWVAVSKGQRQQRVESECSGEQCKRARIGSDKPACGVFHPASERCQGDGSRRVEVMSESPGQELSLGGTGDSGRVDNSRGQRGIVKGQTEQSGDRANDGVPGQAGTGLWGTDSRVEYTTRDRQQGRGRELHDRPSSCGRSCNFLRASGVGNCWSDFDIIPCRDGKYRRIPRYSQSDVQSLADGLPEDLVRMWLACCYGYPLAKGKIQGRTGILRGAGNAIVPVVAARFIRAFLGAEEEIKEKERQ